MNKLLVSLTLGAFICCPSAHAVSVTIDSTLTDTDTFVFDVFWPSQQSTPTSITSPTTAFGQSVYALDNVTSMDTYVLWPGHFIDPLFIFFPSASDRSFNSALLSSVRPTELDPIADGFGARFIYGELPTKLPTAQVPDHATSLSLLGLALAGCVAFKKWRERQLPVYAPIRAPRRAQSTSQDCLRTGAFRL